MNTMKRWIAGIALIAVASAFSGFALASDSGPYACNLYKTKYARENCHRFETVYQDCASGKTKLTITCADLRNNDKAWLLRNDIAANDIPDDPAKDAAKLASLEREALASKWANTMSQGYYRHVQPQVRKQKGGYAIYAKHDFFSRHQFKIGDDTDIANNFIREYYSDTTRLNVVRIGVMNEDGPQSWFDLRR